MCKIVEDYAKEYGDEREIKSKIKFVKNLLKMGMSLDNALVATELDRETYEKYSSKQ